MEQNVPLKPEVEEAKPRTEPLPNGEMRHNLLVYNVRKTFHVYCILQ